MGSTLGENIWEARHMAGLTQKELAQKVGVPYQTVQFWEQGKRNPKLENVKKIAGALNVRWEELYPKEQKSAAEAEDIFSFINQMADHEIQTPIKCAGPFEPTAKERKLLQYFRALNDNGQNAAIERVQELSQLSKYQRHEPDTGEE